MHETSSGTKLKFNFFLINALFLHITSFRLSISYYYCYYYYYYYPKY